MIFRRQFGKNVELILEIYIDDIPVTISRRIMSEWEILKGICWEIKCFIRGTIRETESGNITREILGLVWGEIFERIFRMKFISYNK